MCIRDRHREADFKGLFDSTLPKDVFDQMEESIPTEGKRWKIFATCREATLALHESLTSKNSKQQENNR